MSKRGNNRKKRNRELAIADMALHGGVPMCHIDVSDTYAVATDNEVVVAYAGCQAAGLVSQYARHLYIECSWDDIRGVQFWLIYSCLLKELSQ